MTSGFRQTALRCTRKLKALRQGLNSDCYPTKVCYHFLVHRHELFLSSYYVLQLWCTILHLKQTSHRCTLTHVGMYCTKEIGSFVNNYDQSIPKCIYSSFLSYVNRENRDSYTTLIIFPEHSSFISHLVSIIRLQQVHVYKREHWFRFLAIWFSSQRLVHPR